MICIDKESDVFKVEGKTEDIIAEMSGLAAMMTKHYCEQTGHTAKKGLDTILNLVKTGAGNIILHWANNGEPIHRK